MSTTQGSPVEHYAKHLITQERRGLSTLPSKPLFCAVAWSEGSTPDSSRFDLTATDGAHAWQLTGAGPPNNNSHMLRGDEYMSACKAALCSPQPKDSYEFIITRSNARLRLDLRWRCSSIEGMATIQLDLIPVPNDNAPDVLGSMFELLCNGYASLKASVIQLTSINTQLVKQLSDTQNQLAKQKQESTQREEDLYIKFSMLLNTKKAKLRDLQDEYHTRGQQIQTLQEQLRQAAVAGGDSDHGSGTDREDQISIAAGEDQQQEMQGQSPDKHSNMDVDMDGRSTAAPPSGGVEPVTARNIRDPRYISIDMGQPGASGMVGVRQDVHRVRHQVNARAVQPETLTSGGVSNHHHILNAMQPNASGGDVSSGAPGGSTLQALMEADTQPQVEISGAARHLVFNDHANQVGGAANAGAASVQGTGVGQFPVWEGDTQPVNPSVWAGRVQGSQHTRLSESPAVAVPAQGVDDDSDELDLGL